MSTGEAILAISAEVFSKTDNLAMLGEFMETIFAFFDASVSFHSCLAEF